jgi:hypothetical protein
MITVQLALLFSYLDRAWPRFFCCGVSTLATITCEWQSRVPSWVESLLKSRKHHKVRFLYFSLFRVTCKPRCLYNKVGFQ